MERTAHAQFDGNRLAIGNNSWGGSVFARDASGNWMFEGWLRGDLSGSTDGAAGSPLAISGEWGAVPAPWGDDPDFNPLPAPRVTMSRRTGTSGTDQWTVTQRIPVDPGHGVGQVLLQGQRLFVGDIEQLGTAVYQLDGSQQWVPAGRLLSGGEAMNDQWPGSPYEHDGSIESMSSYVLRHIFDYDRQQKVVQVFQPISGSYQHVATLVPSDGGAFTGQIAVSGTRVLLAGWNHAYYYELPATFAAPASIQDTFSGATAPGWTMLPNSQFTIAQSGYSRAFRQINTTADAGAVLDAANWTNQSIQVDVKPTAINGSDRWVGLFTRRTDAANYYYVTFRSSGVIQLKRMSQGVFQTLATAPAAFAVNRRYRLRLESVGSLHRVYLDGVKLLEARDGALAQGRPGLLTSRAAADFDNVVVSPTSTLTVYQSPIYEFGCLPVCPNQKPWRYAGGQWVEAQDGARNYTRQTSLDGLSRAFIGQRTDNPDMVVESLARLRAYGPGEDRWFGIMARVNDDATNYIWLALRQSNTVTLRKVENGVVTQLAATAFNVIPGNWYRLRLETIGDRVRGYINGQQVLEAIDSQPKAGAAGRVVYKTQADFDDYLAVQP
jgi:hypothetical protein